MPLVDLDGSTNLGTVRVSLTEPASLSLAISGENSSLNVCGNEYERAEVSLRKQFISWGSITLLLLGCFPKMPLYLKRKGPEFLYRTEV